MNLKFRNFITPMLLIGSFYGNTAVGAAQLSDVIDVVGALGTSAPAVPTVAKALAMGPVMELAIDAGSSLDQLWLSPNFKNGQFAELALQITFASEFNEISQALLKGNKVILWYQVVKNNVMFVAYNGADQTIICAGTFKSIQDSTNQAILASAVFDHMVIAFKSTDMQAVNNASASLNPAVISIQTNTAFVAPAAPAPVTKTIPAASGSAPLSDVISVIEALAPAAATPVAKAVTPPVVVTPSTVAPAAATPVAKAVTPPVVVTPSTVDSNNINLTTNNILDLTVVSLAGTPAHSSTYFSANWSAIQNAVTSLIPGSGSITFTIDESNKVITAPGGISQPLSVSGAPYLIIATDGNKYISTALATSGSFVINVLSAAAASVHLYHQERSTITLPSNVLNGFAVYTTSAGKLGWKVRPSYLGNQNFMPVFNAVKGYVTASKPLEVVLNETSTESMIDFNFDQETITSMNVNPNEDTGAPYIALVKDGNNNYQTAIFDANASLNITVFSASGPATVLPTSVSTPVNQQIKVPAGQEFVSFAITCGNSTVVMPAGDIANLNAAFATPQTLTGLVGTLNSQSLIFLIKNAAGIGVAGIDIPAAGVTNAGYTLKYTLAETATGDIQLTQTINYNPLNQPVSIISVS